MTGGASFCVDGVGPLSIRYGEIRRRLAIRGAAISSLPLAAAVAAAAAAAVAAAGSLLTPGKRQTADEEGYEPSCQAGFLHWMILHSDTNARRRERCSPVDARLPLHPRIAVRCGSICTATLQSRRTLHEHTYFLICRGSNGVAVRLSPG